jgi:DNA-binding Lrp family transcriptional regulator
LVNNSDKIDELDRKILSLIQEDSRLTMQQIAKSIGNISKVAVSYRLKKLEDREIIERYNAKLNPEKLDRGYLVISRAMCNVKGQKELEVSKKIARLPGIQSVYGIFGDYDLMIVARTRNKEEAKKLLDKINGIPGVTSSNTIVAHTVVKESLSLDLSKTES